MWECNLELSDLKTCEVKYVRSDKLEEEDEIDLTQGEEREDVISKQTRKNRHENYFSLDNYFWPTIT